MDREPTPDERLISRPAVPPAVRFTPERRAEIARQQAAETLTRVRRGVYVPTPAERQPSLQCRAEHLADVRGVVERFTTRYWFSHVTAALLWGCWTWHLGREVHLTQVRRSAHHRARDVRVVRHWSAVPERDRDVIEGIAVVSLERAMVDCARSLRFSQALVIADSGLRLGARQERLDTIVAEQQGRRGIRQARLVLGLADGRAESPGESLVRHAAWAAGLPVPTPQVPVRLDAGVVWIDLGWPEIRVGVEFDGEVKYSGRYGDPAAALRAEKRRHDALVNAGWWIVRIGWSDLGDPEALGCLLRRAYGIRLR